MDEMFLPKKYQNTYMVNKGILTNVIVINKLITWVDEWFGIKKYNENKNYKSKIKRVVCIF